MIQQHHLSEKENIVKFLEKVPKFIGYTLRNSCGFIKQPDPGGEPVKITSPGCRVQNFEHQATISSVLNTMCFVLEFCLISPFTIHLILSSCGLAISSFVTIQGPRVR